MYTDGCALWRPDETLALEMQKQVMDLYFCAEVRYFDTSQKKNCGGLVVVRECDVLGQGMVFCSWFEAPEIFQAVVQIWGKLLYEVKPVVYSWIVQCPYLGWGSLLQVKPVPCESQERKVERVQEMGESFCPRAEQQSRISQ